MIEYIIAHSPDDRVLDKAVSLLKSGKLVCLPSDTNWIILADYTHKDSIKKLNKIKGENSQKHFSLLCPNLSKASDIALMSDKAFRIIRKASPGNYTFILEASKLIKKSLKASKTDSEVGIRFSPSILVGKLLEKMDQSLMGTNIPFEDFGVDTIGEIYSYMIEERFSNELDMIIDPGEFEFDGISTIVDLRDENAFEIMREGQGDPNIL
jgi:tRNA threonylcarbamoyl adenosine modification protein (Sua5/YciO/YrdC/YwlC family)